MKDSFYKRLLDNASDLIWAIDMEGKFIYINNNIREWGYDKDELIGQPLLSILNTKSIGKRAKEPADLGFRQSFEMEIVDKRGDAHKVVVNASPLLGDDESIIGVMGIIRDVTEVLKLEERLKTEGRLASLGRLATGIAHEIRNPLSSVKMNLSILKSRLNPSGVDVEHFDIAQKEVANLENIITELLDYAKPMPLKLRRQNIHGAIQEVLATLAPVFEENKISINKILTPNDSMIIFDKDKIHQALLNILLNAAQSSEPGADLEIRTDHANQPERMLTITIKDNGKGIDPKNLKYVFDPFFTTKSNGTGLGLSIVRNILDNHNGEISIESELGAGTIVCLSFPAD